MTPYHWPQWLLFFYVYCFLGWCFESALVSIARRRFVNRGFLKGPFLPIYGTGALAILLLTLPVRENLLLVFLLGMLAATVLEFVTGACMERLFKVRYWDYSHKRFNVHGYICLSSSLAWGALSVALIAFLHPAAERFVLHLSVDMVRAVNFVLSVVFAYDFVSSFRAAYSLRKLIEQSARLRREVDALRARVDALGQVADQARQELRERTEDVLDDIRARAAALQDVPDELRARYESCRAAIEQLRAQSGRDLSRLIRRNPSATSSRYRQALADTIERIRSVDEREIERIEQEQNRFAQGINAYKVFWIFFLGSILGVVIETLFCLMTRGHYENRVGVIWGPFNPVYGFGCVALTLGLYFLRFHRDLHILFFGAIIGNAVEYFCSWAQEQVFGSTSWDYSSMPYNINGRICLLYGLFWGILACYWIKNIFPLLNAWILRIPQRIGKALTWVLCVLLCADMALSAWAVLRWVERDQGTPPRNAVERFFDARFGDERMQMLFPNMTFTSELTSE